MTYEETKAIEEKAWNYKLCTESEIPSKTIAKVKTLYAGLISSKHYLVLYFTDNTIAIYDTELNSWQVCIPLFHSRYDTDRKKAWACESDLATALVEEGILDSDTMLTAREAWVQYEYGRAKEKISKAIDEKLKEIKNLKNQLV